MSASNDQNAQAKEVMRQEQFWFTATTLGFTGFVGALLKTPSLWDMLISLSLICVLTVFSVYLIVVRHKAYCALNGTKFPSWCEAFKHSVRERSGALYCVVVVSFAAIGFTLIIFMRFLTPFPPNQPVGSQIVQSSSTSALVPMTIPTSNSSTAVHKP